MEVMRRMNSESVDLIYLDPPFNSNANYAAPIGSIAAGAEFKDTWGLDDIKVAWHALVQKEHPELYQYLKAVPAIHSKSMMAYMIYMTVRIMEIKRLLKPTGSIYLHCDPTASHYLKLLMDCIFGKKYFRNEIVWCYPPGGKPPKYALHRKHDVIFYYSVGTPKFNPVFRPMTEYQKSKFTSIDEHGRKYKEYRGKTRTYLDDLPGSPVPDWWDDIHSLGQTISKERVGYPTQKPLVLLKRIIKASSSEEDVVLDPFCGCATTCVAAEDLKRRWAGIDISPKAAE